MNDKLRIVSLFSGIGGFEEGFKNSDVEFKIVFASEIDKFAIKTYSCNFPIDTMHGDIKLINEKDIPDHDLLCAGFPCQSFSVAGKQKGFKDIRGTLFFDIIRIIKEKKPKYLFLENVKNLISHDQGNTIKIILKNISDCGYTFDIDIINSNEAGVPQNRERIYIVAKYNKKREKFKLDKKNSKINEIKNWANNNNLKTMNFFNKIIFNKKQKHIIDILEKNVDKKYYINSSKVKRYLTDINFSFFKNEKQNKIIKEFDLPKEIHNDLERQRRIYSIYGISPTLLARSDSTKIILKIDGTYKIRKLTPLESLKIQGFNETFVKNIKNNEMSDTQLYKQSGNAVSPPIITDIMNGIKEHLYD